MNETQRLKLNTGSTIPAIGFGTWQLEEGKETKRSVAVALEAGYRLVDTAKLYGNEKSVSEAVRESNIPREAIFVTTKLWNTDHGNDNTLRAFDASLERLGVDYIDLYLIHWPASEKLNETWQALVEIYRQGRAKAIGVSNYSVMHLQDLMNGSDTVSAINQLEFHPFVGSEQKKLVKYCLRHNIVVMAYSPLAQGRQMENEVIVSIASAHSKSSAQVMLRWAIQHGTVPIPRSSNPERIKSNLQVCDFELTDKDMAALEVLS